MNTATLRHMAKQKEELSPELKAALEGLRKRIKSSLKAKVKTTREDLGYSQNDVLKELERYGLARTQGSVSQIELGFRLPSVEALYVLAKYLNTSTDYLLGLTENALAPADIEEELSASNGEGKINRIMRRLSSERQQAVVQFAEFLAAHPTTASSNIFLSPPLSEKDYIEQEAKRLMELVDATYGSDVRKSIDKSFHEHRIINS